MGGAECGVGVAREELDGTAAPAATVTLGRGRVVFTAGVAPVGVERDGVADTFTAPVEVDAFAAAAAAVTTSVAEVNARVVRSCFRFSARAAKPAAEYDDAEEDAEVRSAEMAVAVVVVAVDVASDMAAVAAAAARFARTDA